MIDPPAVPARSPLTVCMTLLKAYAVFRPELGQPFGGAEAQFYLISRRLARDPDFQVHLISRDYGQPDGEILDGVIHRKIAQRLPACLRRWRPVVDLVSALRLYGVLRSVNAAVHVQFCAGVETGIVARCCRRQGGKMVFMAASDRDLDGGYEAAFSPVVRHAYRYGLRRSDRVICQNARQVQCLRQRFGREGTILPSVCELPEAYAAPRGNDVLWVARLAPLKRPEVFLELARRLPDRSFVMVAAMGNDADYYHHILDQARAIPNLQVHANVPYQEVGDRFAEARLFVNTSEYEGFPNTFLQAMQHGVPLVSMNVNPSDILTRHGVGLVSGPDIESLCCAVMVLLDDAERYNAMSRNAFAYVKEHHEIGAVVERFKALFRELAHPTPEP